MKSQSSFRRLILLAILVLGIAGCINNKKEYKNLQKENLPISRTIEGNFLVTYELQLKETITETLYDVSSIQFNDKFIFIKTPKGDGVCILTDKLNKLQWENVKKNKPES